MSTIYEYSYDNINWTEGAQDSFLAQSALFKRAKSSNSVELPVGICPVVKSFKKCTCGAHKTWGSNCNTHSRWCDLHGV